MTNVRKIPISSITEAAGIKRAQETFKKNQDKLINALDRGSELAASGSNSIQPLKQDAIFEGATRIPVNRIDFYEHNPRTKKNERFEELKLSLQTHGQEKPITVTKRPNSQNYIVSAGGNTTLMAIKELAHETNDARFTQPWVFERPYKDEMSLLVSHISENYNRADLCFFDEAKSFNHLKQVIESTIGKKLSLRECVNEFQKHGLKVNHSALSLRLFAAENLNSLGLVALELREVDVKKLRPIVNSIENLSQTANIDATAILNNVLQQYAQRHEASVAINLDDIITQYFDLAATALSITAKRLNAIVALSAQMPDLSYPELSNALDKPQTSQPGEIGKTSKSDASQVSDSIHKAKTITTLSDSIVSQSNQQKYEAGESSSAIVPSKFPLATSGPVNSLSNIVAIEDDHIHKNNIHTIITELCDVAGVNDCLVLNETLTNGYYMEFPDEGINHIPFEQRRIYTAVWQMLSAFSGQYDEDVVDQLPDDSRWKIIFNCRDALSENFETEFPLTTGGICGANGEPGIEMVQIQYVLTHPVCGSLFAELLSMIRK